MNPEITISEDYNMILGTTEILASLLFIAFFIFLALTVRKLLKLKKD
jgi:hypothetical protein